MAIEEVKVPDLGEFDSVEVIEVHIAPGDVIKPEDPLITLESDKASVEVPSPSAGKVVEVMLNEGAAVKEGTLILTLEVEGKAATPPKKDKKQAEAKPQAQSQEAQPQPQSPPPVLSEGADILAGPAARRLARELEVDLSALTGTGNKNRITREDVKKAFLARAGSGVGSGIAAPPRPNPEEFGAVERIRLSRFKRTGAKRLAYAWATIPHVTHYDEADITELEAVRKKARKRNPKLTQLPFIMKACAEIFPEMPSFNAMLGEKEGELLIRKHVHISLAVALEEGLVAPVLRDVDKKSVVKLANETAALVERAKNSKLSPKDVSGGGFSISNLGGIGGTGFSPIIQPYQTSVLALSRAKMKPVWDGKAFQPRLMMPFSLSYDHRVIDGAEAAAFCRRLAGMLEDVALLALSG